MVRELERRADSEGVDVVVCDTGPDTARGWRYHFQRVQLNLASVVVLFTGTKRARVRPVSVYIGGSGGLGLAYQLVLVATCRTMRIPTYFHHHSFAYINERSLLMALIVRCGGRRLRHVYLGPTMQRRFGELYRPGGHAYQCSNAVAVDSDETSRPEGSTVPAGPAGPQSDSGPVLGHISNLSRAKGLYDVMDAFDNVSAVNARARLRIAGGVSDLAEKADLMRFCQRHDGAVDWIGPIPNSAVAAFMSGIDLLLFPSRYVNEAQPLVVLEAMRMGTPVAAYDVGEVANCIGPGGAVCAESDSFADLVTNLVQADNDKKNHLEQMGTRAAHQFSDSLYAAEDAVTHLAGDLLSKQRW